jgi:hypothetical protein
VATRRKLKGGFKVGDLVTGKNRSYHRSVYKVIGPGGSPKYLLLEFVSLGHDVVMNYKRRNAPLGMYQTFRQHARFRKVTKKERKESNKTTARWYLLEILKLLGLNVP